jgi:hypothetical protein
VEAIFLEARKLCALVHEVAGKGTPPDAGTRLTAIGREFSAKHNLLFQLMQSSNLQSNRAPALRQLILRLNFNSYCEQDSLQEIRGDTEAATM